VRNRVVVTGLGMLSAVGNTRTDTFQALLAGKSGVAEAPAAITCLMPSALAAVASGFDHRLSRAELGLDRATAMALLATREAIDDAAFAPTAAQKEHVGVFSGIGMGGSNTLDGIYENYYETREQKLASGRDPPVLHPLTVARIMSNASASAVSIEYGFTGPIQNYSVACASSALAIGEAYRAIQSGRLHSAVVIGAEAMLVKGVFMGWTAMRVMATPRQGNVAASCRPFDRQRSGFVLGEGAAALVLEREEDALVRGATPYGRIVGFGSTSDARHITLPSEVGQTRAIRQAIEESVEAGLPPDAVRYVNAHGTATQQGDITETRSTRVAFGAHADRLAISSTKSMHGHLIGACGALEFGVSLMALRHGCMPPTANLDDIDPECDLDFITHEARHERELGAVMSNTFAFGGSNVSLIACRMDLQ
jgi:3-oxoacyl-(acyl-carrier-protein) synthase